VGDVGSDFNADTIRDMLNLRDKSFKDVSVAVVATGTLLRDMYFEVVEPVRPEPVVAPVKKGEQESTAPAS
jgi:hypothetical protein